MQLLLMRVIIAANAYKIHSSIHFYNIAAEGVDDNEP
jgi:hypothetical protein